jgi:hypothetical protein
MPIVLLPLQAQQLQQLCIGCAEYHGGCRLVVLAQEGQVVVILPATANTAVQEGPTATANIT